MGCVAAVSFSLLVCCSAWAGPALVLEPPTFDWGRQTENKGEYAYTFTVKNGGDEQVGQGFRVSMFQSLRALCR
jgi:hypothetical protein